MSVEASLITAASVLVGNAFFVGAEFGLISARRSSVELLALQGSRAAKITLKAMEHVSLMLAGAQLGITLCSLTLGAVGEPLIEHMLHAPFHAIGLSESLLEPVSFLLALIIMVYLHVVLGEMVPKNLAMARPERTALLLTPPLVLFVRCIRPAVHVLNTIANGNLRLIGVKPRREVASTFTRDEVAGFVEESRREGLLSEDERDLLSGALQLDERDVSSVLLPLDTLVTAPLGVTPVEIEHLAATTGFSRFPIATKKGKLVGYFHLKDVLHIPEDDYAKPLPRKSIRPLTNVHMRDSLRSALSTMQHSGTHLAQVVGHRGQALGIIMLEDVAEELVGEIRDDSQRQSD
jgi:CBS domain containing-hemolysin-like protein